MTTNRIVFKELKFMNIKEKLTEIIKERKELKEEIKKLKEQLTETSNKVTQYQEELTRIIKSEEVEEDSDEVTQIIKETRRSYIKLVTKLIGRNLEEEERPFTRIEKVTNEVIEKYQECISTESIIASRNILYNYYTEYPEP
jgi:cell division septum initiation protein DivIVA